MSPIQRREILAWIATTVFMVGSLAVLVFTVWMFA